MAAVATDISEERSSGPLRREEASVAVTSGEPAEVTSVAARVRLDFENLVVTAERARALAHVEHARAVIQVSSRGQAPWAKGVVRGNSLSPAKSSVAAIGEATGETER